MFPANPKKGHNVQSLLFDICLTDHIVLNLTLKDWLYLKKINKVDCFQRGCLCRKPNRYYPVGTLKNDFKRAVGIIKRQHEFMLNVEVAEKNSPVRPHMHIY